MCRGILYVNATVVTDEDDDAVDDDDDNDDNDNDDNDDMSSYERDCSVIQIIQ